MSTHAHVERHFRGGAFVRDVVIGMSDGLTVPFALAAGLSGAVASSRLVLTAGLAEIAAGAIAMGLGGYLAARGDADHYRSERAREMREVAEIPDLEAREIEEIFEGYGVTGGEIAPLIAALKRRPDAWVDFMMRFELGLDAPVRGRARASAATIGLSYVVGGLVPLGPYFFVTEASRGLFASAAVTLVALAAFGTLKGHFSGAGALRSGVQTVLIGSLAATAAFLLARAL